MSRFTPEVYDRIFIRDGFRCRYCGFSGKESFLNWMQLTIDHVIPQRFKSCTDDDSNLVTCCHYCNQLTNHIPEKEDTPPEEIKRLKCEHVTKTHKEMFPVWAKAALSFDLAEIYSLKKK